MLFLRPFIHHRFMRIAVYLGKKELGDDKRYLDLVSRLKDGGIHIYVLAGEGIPDAGTDMMMSVGGDGTFLTAAMMAALRGIPVVGVNLGRLGFLSENRPEDVADAILSGSYTVEDRTMLKALDEDGETYALNEFSVHRSGAAMLGVDVSIDGVALPTYWADGLIVSSSSGSTAYSLSAGGPIVLPEARVLIISPIAPHNLNVRPMVVPDSAVVTLKVHSRDTKVIFTADNRTKEVGEGAQMSVSVAQFSLKRVRLTNSDFINALTAKLYWGEDVRNTK